MTEREKCESVNHIPQMILYLGVGLGAINDELTKTQIERVIRSLDYFGLLQMEEAAVDNDMLKTAPPAISCQQFNKGVSGLLP